MNLCIRNLWIIIFIRTYPCVCDLNIPLRSCMHLSLYVVFYLLMNSEALKFPQKQPSCFVLWLQLAMSEDDLQEAQSTFALAKRLQQDISTLHAAITAMQGDDSSSSHNLQTVNAHFLNVTDTWQNRLASITSDLAALKAESREAHAGATGRVNEAERRARSLTEKLEELEDSTRRNARAMERTEEDDAKRVQGQLDWNTKQIQHLEEQTRSLNKREGELSTQLREHIPRAQQCVEQLPQVEEAVRSIVKLGADQSAAEKRLEEVTLQVFGTEDSMLKALTEILELRQEVDALHARNSVLKMKDELSVMKKAVRELTMVLREGRADSQQDSAPPDEEVWRDYEAEVEEEWESLSDDGEETVESLSDDITE